MAEHVVEELYSYASGHLNHTEVSRVEAHLRQCAECRSEADALDQLNTGLTTGPTAVLDKLQQTLSGPGRFEHLLEQVAALFDITVDEARTQLARLEDPATWENELAPGVWLAPVQAGPACGDNFTVLLKIEPGAEFPHHTHGGEEKTLILEGGYRDVSGTEFWRGELDVRTKGTSHSFVGLPGLGCLAAAVTPPHPGEA